MATFEEHHPWFLLYLRGVLLAGVFVGIGIVLDRVQVHSYTGRAVFLAIMISTMGAWAHWERTRRKKNQHHHSRR